MRVRMKVAGVAIALTMGLGATTAAAGPLSVTSYDMQNGDGNASGGEAANRMASTPRTLSRRAQAVVAVSYIALTFTVFFFVLWATSRPGQGPTLQTGYLLGTFVAAVAQTSATWRRVWVTLASAAILGLIGMVSLGLMTLWPSPSMDPLLAASGAWTGGPLSFAAGWDRYVMGGLFLLAGATLPLALLRGAPRTALSAMMILRGALWYGALWQLAWLSSSRGFGRLFAPDTLGVQFALLVLVLVGWMVLIRGERGWLSTLTGSDRSVILARVLMPVMLLPIVAAAIMSLAVRQGAFGADVAPMLNAELSSIALALVGLGALRGLWLERRQASTLAKAVERSPVIIHSESGVVEYWPRGCEALFGFTAAEAVGRRVPELLQTEYPAPMDEIIAILRSTGEWAGEMRHTTKDGRRLWVVTRVIVDRPQADSELKLVETMTGVTDLKISAAALRDSPESFEQVVAGYELGVIDFAPRSGKSRFSPLLEQLLGLEPGGLGSDQAVWARLVHPDDRARSGALLIDDARTKAPGRTVTFKIMHADGEYRDLQGVVRYGYDPRGRLDRIIGVCMDVTEILRDRVEVAKRGERLLELQSELAHTSRLSAMGEMAAAIAHELNQPLAAVGTAVGAIEIMVRDQDRPADAARQQRILRAARHAENQVVRAGEILRRLREFIARGEADTQVEDLALLVDDSLALALPNPAAMKVTVSRRIPRAAARVLADRIQVQQVLVNLIRNAVESMRDQPRPGQLSIAAEVRAEGMCLVRVADNGGGVANDSMTTLFSPFVSTKREGMGVGLSICRRIIEAHGGELWFEPGVEGGAEFRFTLPLAPKSARKPVA